MIFKIIFNILAVTLFITMFFKMIKKNNTQYLYLLVIQFIGILLNFVELILATSFNIVLKIFIYVLSIIIPGIILLLEHKQNMDFPEMLNIILAEWMIHLGKKDNAKKYLLILINKYPENFMGHKLLAEIYEKEGKISNAISEYLSTIEIRPQNFEMNCK